MYSPIKNIYIKNFRNIGEVELSFNKSPIICLVGENEAGKTSVIKAFSVCALHASPRDQKDYIRQGTQMFGIAISLEDGSKIVRMKTNTVNKYEVTRPDGTKWETNKISEGLPVEVQKIMGLIEEPETKEFLHIRTYEDKLLFVVTQASTNYKVMYDALKVDQLTRAIKSGSTEVNGLRSKLNENEASIRTLQNSVHAVNIVDIQPLMDVKSRVTKQMSILDKLDKARSVVSDIEEAKRRMGVLRLINTFNLEEIDIAIAYSLSSINNSLTNMNKLKDCRNKLSSIDNTEEISTIVVDKLKNIMNKIEELNAKKVSAGAIIHVSEISEIPEMQVVQLTRASKLMDMINTYKNKLNTINIGECTEISQSDLDRIDRIKNVVGIQNIISTKKTEKEQYDSCIEPMVQKLKEYGVAFETCPNCGNDVIIDLDKFENAV